MAGLQNNDQYIGQLLIQDRIITERELGLGMLEQKRSKDFLCRTLVRMGFASESKVFSILSLQIGVPFVDLHEVNVDPALVSKIPGNFSRACGFMALKADGDTLSVAMTDPLNSRACEEIKSFLGFRSIKTFLTGDNSLRDALHKYYGI